MIISRFRLAWPLVWFGLMLPVAAQDAVAVPSGQQVTLIGAIWEPQAAPAGLWLRLRYLAPELAGDAGLGIEAVAPDMLALCQTQALPLIAAGPRKADMVIISLSEQAVAFGESNSDITQYFEAYRITDDGCMLEEF